MNYLGPEFKHDLFVSYASGDADGEGVTRLKTWSLKFADILTKEIKGTPGFKDFELFVDEGPRDAHRLHPHESLTEEVLQAVQSSALILYVVSPAYVESTWCTKERQRWKRHSGEDFAEGLSREFFARIWPLDKMPLEKTKWPKELCDSVGEPPIGRLFYPLPAEHPYTRPFGWPVPPGPDEKFDKAAVTLAGDVCVALSEFREALARKRRAQADIDRLENASSHALFVHAKSQDAPKWHAAAKALVEAGFGVFPIGPEMEAVDPRESLRSEKELVQTLSQCDGLLIVAGGDAGSLSRDLVITGRGRRNSAKALGNRPLPCAVVDHGLQHENKLLLQASARNLGIHWIDAQPADWPNLVRGWLQSSGQSLRT